MVERRPVRLPTNATRTTPPAPVAFRQSGGGGWMVIGLIVAAVVGVSKCSSNGTGTTDVPSSSAEVVGNAQQALVSAVAAQTPPPVLDLSTKSMRRGASRVGLASEEGLAGEVIYSQNCYDALSREFTWSKLDECGGFDAEASLTLGDDEPVGSEKEVAWFDGEAAAGRYLKAAVAAGQDADAADARLAALQASIGRTHKPKVPATTEPEGGNTIESAPVGDVDGEGVG